MSPADCSWEGGVSASNNEFLVEMKQLLNVTSRVDERVKSLIENQQEINGRLNRYIDEQSRLASKIAVLEQHGGSKLKDGLDMLDDHMVDITHRLGLIEQGFNPLHAKEQETIRNELASIKNRLEKVETSSNNLIGSIQKVGGLVIQMLWVIITCYLLYKLGLNSPPLP